MARGVASGAGRVTGFGPLLDGVGGWAAPVASLAPKPGPTGRNRWRVPPAKARCSATGMPALVRTAMSTVGDDPVDVVRLALSAVRS